MSTVESRSQTHASLSPNQAGMRLLQLASDNKTFRTKEVDDLLAANPDLNVQNADGDGILSLALRNHHHGLFRRVLYAGADPNLRNIRHEPPLKCAIMMLKLREATELIHAGAEVDSPIPESGDSMLEYAVTTKMASATMLSMLHAGKTNAGKGGAEEWEKVVGIADEMIALLLECGAYIEGNSDVLMQCKQVADYHTTATQAVDAVISTHPVDTSLITPELICTAATLGREQELIESGEWSAHRGQLQHVITALPPCLSRRVLNGGVASYLLSNPDSSVQMPCAQRTILSTNTHTQDR